MQNNTATTYHFVCYHEFLDDITLKHTYEKHKYLDKSFFIRSSAPMIICFKTGFLLLQ